MADDITAQPVTIKKDGVLMDVELTEMFLLN